MQNNSDRLITEEGTELRVYPEEREEITFSMPKLSLQALEKIAKQKDLPLLALVKFYIGQGMRNDMTEKESGDLALNRLRAGRNAAKKTKADLAA